MLTKRIIPCLDVNAGRVVKGVNFVNLTDAGDPVEIAKAYNEEGADELVFLDITASSDKRKTVVDMVRRVAEQVFIPFTVGGGVNSVEDMKQILREGADKVSINTAAIRNPELIREGAKKFGNQCIVVAKKAVSLGAGEILLTSMDCDGTKNGYDLELTRAVSDAVGVPVIASGGAGKLEDFYTALTEGGADAALAASLFHYRELAIGEVKEYLEERGVPVRF